DQLAPLLEQARNASNVRWRAARLRINHLLAPAFETAEKNRETKSAESAAKPESKADLEAEKDQDKDDAKETTASDSSGELAKQGGKQGESKRPARSGEHQKATAESARETRQRA